MRASVLSDRPAASPSVPGPREARPRPAQVRRPPAARTALAHGAYLIAAGAWPIVHQRSFAAAAHARPGRAIKGAGACLANIGTALLGAGARGKVSRELRMLGVGTALACAGMEVYAALVRRRATAIGLVDAAIQLAFAGLWGITALREARELQRPPEPAFA